MSQERAVEVRGSQALAALSDAQIATISLSIQQAEKLVFTVLQAGIDYGPHPGTDSMALKDSGGSTIANAFNCYPEHTILYSREDEEVISYLVQAKLIQRSTGKVVAVGVGACSTMESKYAYRWVTNPEDYGHDKNALRFDKSKKKWRIPNPEVEDLGNTILKMASKRAEIDGAQSLPGVGSALKKLFQGGKQEEKPNWQRFWGEVSALGLSEEDVHQMLGIKSLKEDWLAKGKGLNQAVQVLAEKVSKDGKPPSGDRFPQPDRDPESLKDMNALFKACFDDWGMQPVDVAKALGYGATQDMPTNKKPADYYLEIKAVRSPKE